MTFGSLQGLPNRSELFVSAPSLKNLRPQRAPLEPPLRTYDKQLVSTATKGRLPRHGLHGDLVYDAGGRGTDGSQHQSPDEGDHSP